jgi:hypothetical protein
MINKLARKIQSYILQEIPNPSPADVAEIAEALTANLVIMLSTQLSMEETAELVSRLVNKELEFAKQIQEEL